jgi:deazaflavin-dependent oxidoreductase (nitroreductase family)
VSVRRPGPALRLLFRAPTFVYRADLGWLLGERFLMLTHVGRRSGRCYRTVLEVVARLEASDEFVVTAGRGHSADWLLNSRAGGAREIAVGHRRFHPQVRLLAPEEAAGLLGEYERRNRLIAPVVRRVLSGLVGWRYTGTDDERRRLVGQLPLIAFRPAGSPTGDGVPTSGP